MVNANFVGSPLSGTLPKSVTFTNLSTGADGFRWFFGSTPDENHDTWTEQTTPSAWSPRYSFGYTLMADGSIIVAGGANASGLANNESWRGVITAPGDIQTISWTRTNNNSPWSARWGLTAVGLSDGSVVIMGGFDNNGNCLNDVWRSTDNGITWIKQSSGGYWTPRYDHGSIVMANGDIVIAGGNDSAGGQTQVADVWKSIDKGVTWTLQTSSPLWAARAPGGGLVHLHDDSIVLVAGKYFTYPGYYSDVYRSIDEGSTWSLQTSGTGWNTAFGQIITVGTDNTIYAMGGWSNVATFDDTSHVWKSIDKGATWTALSDGSWGIRELGGAIVSSATGYIYMFGGFNLYGTSIYNDAWFSNNSGSSWNAVTIPAVGWTARFDHASAVLADGSILIFGGYTGTANRNDVLKSTDKGQTWTTIKSNNGVGWSARWGLSANVLANGHIIVAGGFDTNYLNDVWQSTDGGVTWSQLVAHAGWTARTNHRVVLKGNGRLLLTGGVDGAQSYSDAWVSIDGGSTWTLQSNGLYPPRYLHACASLPDGSTLIIGGSNNISDPTVQPIWGDYWRTSDDGVTWDRIALATPSLGWITGSVAVVSPDGNIVLIGGLAAGDPAPDTTMWISTDGGYIWAYAFPDVSANPWTGRYHHTCEILPDGSILVIGGST